MKSRPPVVPKKFAGKWIAWNTGHNKIIASGKTLRVVADQVKRTRERQPGFEWVPPADRRLIGARR